MLVFYLLLTITATGVYKYLPQQLVVLQSRMVYYFFGAEAERGPVANVTRLVAGLVAVAGNASREL